MPETRDITATTNPAYFSLVIYAFVEAFTKTAGEPPDLPLCFIPIPCVLSTMVAARFAGTNTSTGLLEWLTRNPELQVELAQHVSKTRELSRAGLLFGLQQGILEVGNDATVLAKQGQLFRVPKDGPNLDASKRVFSLTSRLGTWCGAVGTASIIFTALGIRP